jgi:hypothetical protein
LAVEALEAIIEEHQHAEETAHGSRDHFGAQAVRGRRQDNEHLPQAGVSQAAFYMWKKQYAGLG